jgi:membrane associated rhomboid family serine protease
VLAARLKKALPDKQPSYAGRPSVCRNCGALIGAGENSCQVCDASLPAGPSPALPLHERDAMSYARAVLSRPYIFTIVFLVANLFIFLLMWEASGMQTSVLWGQFPEDVLVGFGAKTNYWIHNGHQYWRLVTPIFIHVNLLHVLINMYSLWVIGPWVEKLYGSAKFVVFWVVTGIAGVLASYLTVVPGSHPGVIGSFLIKAGDDPSAGASGALFGLVGVLFVFGIKYRHELPEGFKRAFGTGMLPIILLNLGIGFMARGIIDNAAHMGGLISGAAFAAVVSYKRPGMPASVTLAWRAVQIAALVLVIGCFFMAARAHRQNPEAGARSRSSSDLTARNRQAAVFDANNSAFGAGEVAAINALKKGDASGINPAIAQLDKTEHFDDQTDVIRAELKSLLGRTGKYVNYWQPPRQVTPDGVAEQRKLIDDFKRWQTSYDNWFWSEGKQFGVQRPKPTSTI